MQYSKCNAVVIHFKAWLAEARMGNGSFDGNFPLAINSISYWFAMVIWPFRTVYKCRTVDGKDCCVKKISLVAASEHLTLKHLQMIRKEVYILANLNHPRVIRFLSYFTMAKDRHFYIAMEYACNGALSTYLTNRRCRLQYLAEDVSTKSLFLSTGK